MVRENELQTPPASESSVRESAGNAPNETAEPTRTSRRRRRRIILLIYAAYLLLLAELGARGMFTVRYGVPFFHMSGIWQYRFYPELVQSGVLDTKITKDDGAFDILLLGGSVLIERHGPIATLLQQRLQEATGKHVRVFNCANSALSSRDSLLKYEKLDHQQFDLVVFYHAINEARMNNWPRAKFRDDYSHCAWYAQLNRFEKHSEVGYLTLPYAVEFSVIGLLDSPTVGWYLPRGESAWTEDSLDVKTGAAFRNNLTAILDLAQARNQKVMLLGYAYYVPDDYTYEKFRAKQLDYASHYGAVELWGPVEGVRKAIDEHNRITQELAGRYDDTLYVDQDALIPKDGKRNFNDPCHLTDAGCEIFVDNIVEPIADLIRATDHFDAAATQ